MTKKEIQLKRQLELKKYLIEYESNKDYYNAETVALLALQIPFLELIETQMKVNPNHLLKKLHFALNEWINEPVISVSMHKEKDDSIDQYTKLSNLGFENVEDLRKKINRDCVV